MCVWLSHTFIPCLLSLHKQQHLLSHGTSDPLPFPHNVILWVFGLNFAGKRRGRWAGRDAGGDFEQKQAQPACWHCTALPCPWSLLMCGHPSFMQHGCASNNVVMSQHLYFLCLHFPLLPLPLLLMCVAIILSCVYDWLCACVLLPPWQQLPVTGWQLLWRQHAQHGSMSVAWLAGHGMAWLHAGWVGGVLLSPVLLYLHAGWWWTLTYLHIKRKDANSLAFAGKDKQNFI